MVRLQCQVTWNSAWKCLITSKRCIDGAIGLTYICQQCWLYFDLFDETVNAFKCS